MAIEAAVAHLHTQLVETLEAHTALARGCFDAVRMRLMDEAAARGVALRELACTFLGVLSSSTSSVIFQIGDGAVVVDVGDGLSIPVLPMNGDYINTTRFAVDEDAPERIEFVDFDRPVLRAAVLSDGVQGIATNMANHTPHDPFFAPFFRTMGSDEAEGRDDELQASLAVFLSSERVNAKTDDDKTLALAIAVP